MGVVTCLQCINKNTNNEEKYGHLNVDINPEPLSDQYMNAETKIGGFSAGTLKKKKTLKIDKSNFVRIKNDNFIDEYELKEKLGEGGYGSVYKVLQRKTNYLILLATIKSLFICTPILHMWMY